jgi:AP-3 complex subunit beta
MKWLLASMSKGRNVSDFFPHVVKLVGTQNLEVRKMVYTYLVHYANYDASCRELALLSINAFQRGLTDGDSAWIRASALRVLTSINVSDVLQIQILGVKKCIHDPSPYVRKCAANALCKLHPRIPPHMDNMKSDLIDDCWVELIKNEASVAVLSSCIISFVEICPERLELLHPVFRKLCHLLADLDEWGQIITMEVLTRYCRKFFKKPIAVGKADIIDSQRKIKRVVGVESTLETSSLVLTKQTSDTITASHHSPLSAIPNKVKRRVVKKGFYSDEEDVSTEEDVYVAPNTGKTHKSIASALREEHLIGNATGPLTADTTIISGQTLVMEEDEDDHASLDPDHKMLLQCSLPLLKSRNSGVVLAVCSLQYYCGVASVRIRSAIGKALVRIYHDRREIQYIVLRSIKALVYECPSAFTPFLSDFFVKVPSFCVLYSIFKITRVKSSQLVLLIGHGSVIYTPYQTGHFDRTGFGTEGHSSSIK